MKISKKLCFRMDGSQFFFCCDGLQPKISAGMIKDHECNITLNSEKTCLAPKSPNFILQNLNLTSDTHSFNSFQSIAKNIQFFM